MKKHPKKQHPHGLPHLSDATSTGELLQGSAAWADQLASGNYEFVVAEEHAIDDDTDLLVVVRKRVKK